MDRRHLLLGLALAALPQLAMADAKPPVPLSKVFVFLDKYLALPMAERTRFGPAYSLLLDNKPATNLKAVILEADGRRTPLVLGPDGRAKALPTLAQLQTAKLEVDVPATAKMSINLSIVPLLPLTQDQSAKDLDLAIAQANRGVSGIAGVMSFAAPKLVAVGFVGAGSGTLRFADGKEEPLPLYKGVPFYDPKLARGAVAVILARVPTRLIFKG